MNNGTVFLYYIPFFSLCVYSKTKVFAAFGEKSACFVKSTENIFFSSLNYSYFFH